MLKKSGGNGQWPDEKTSGSKNGGQPGPQSLWITPVSYTHLDVYKRQVRAWVADAEPLIFVSAEGRDFEEVNRLAVALAKEIGASVAPAEEPAIDGEAIPVSETQA